VSDREERRPADQQPASRPVDASMTLLREVMERPLDPSYAAAAASPHPRTRRGTALTLVLAIAAGAAFAVSVSSIRQPQRQATQVNNRLRTEIEKRSKAVEEREAANAALSAANELTQRNALGAGGAALAAQAGSLGLAVGEVPVTGPGLRFTLDDAPDAQDAVGGDPRAATDFEEGAIFDADLQTVVNGLWAAGAESIAVNRQRLTPLSAIRSAGQAILVDFRPLRRPYVIEAIGDPTRMQATFAAGTAGAYVQSMRDNVHIRADIATSKKLVLPGAGQLVLREARPLTSSTPTTSTGTG
jgi:uncharacterized protein YlxW (UPF0749 family)